MWYYRNMKKRLIAFYLRVYFGVRNSWLVWYYLLNKRARAAYSAKTPKLSSTQERIIAELKRDGIAFSNLSELFPGENVLDALQQWEHSHQTDAASTTKKEFLKTYWDSSTHPYTLDNPFFTLAIRDEVLGIVNTYDEMNRSLNYVHLARTTPAGDAAPVFTQRWHRDPEESRMMKFFVYLTDVDEDAGPFTFLKESNFGDRKYGSLFPQKLPLGVYPDEKELNAKVDATDVVPALGVAGTVIFCDTAGLHRGGYSKSKERVMFTAFYPSEWWAEKRRYTVPKEVDEKITNASARFALGIGQ